MVHFDRGVGRTPGRLSNVQRQPILDKSTDGTTQLPRPGEGGGVEVRGEREGVAPGDDGARGTPGAPVAPRAARRSRSMTDGPKVLGINRNTLRARIRELGLQVVRS